MKRRQVLQLGAATWALNLSFAQAQGSTQVKVLVGYPAGGAPDAVARLYADQVRHVGGMNTVVENRTGATGKLAIDALLAAAPDGFTMAVIPSSSLLLTPMVLKSATYDSARDFAPVASLAEYGFALAVGPGTPARDLPSFIAWAKANPGKASFATPGLGTPQHFLGSALAKAAGIELTHVPYRGGAPALTDVLGGQVAALITTESLIVPHQAAGKLRGLFVTSPMRNSKLSEVPTVREAGYAQLETSDWFGLFVKAGTPAAKLADLRQQTVAVLGLKPYADAIQELGYNQPSPDASKLPARIEKERAEWTSRVVASGFKATD